MDPSVTLLAVSGLAVLARPRRERAGHILDDGAGRTLENGLKGDIELLLSLLRDPGRVSPGCRSAQQGSERARLLVLLPRPIPDRFHEIGARLPVILQNLLINFAKLFSGHAETQGCFDSGVHFMLSHDRDSACKEFA